MTRPRVPVATSLALCALACGGEPVSRGPAASGAPTQPLATFVIDAPAESDLSNDADDVLESERMAVGGPVPVEADDAVWGSDDALATIVAFIDYQCPFSKRAWGTLQQLMQTRAPSVRVAFKHNPLPFHHQAKPTAVAAQAVLDLGGVEAFLRFSREAFDNQGESDPEMYERWAIATGVDGAGFRHALGDPRYTAEVERDMELAKSLRMRGTPSFSINGIRVLGAVSYEKFIEAIDTELPLARAAHARGLEGWRLYEERTTANFELPSTRQARPSRATPPDLTIYRIPVDKSPTLGPKDALITIVQFVGFQCPFCKKAQATLEELRRRYPNQIRIVLKHYPLPFHDRARVAANFATYAYQVGGSPKFFEAARLLFDSAPDLSDTALSAIAKQLGLRPKAALAAAHAERYRAVIAADERLARDFEVKGSPQFFINGQRLAGALPIESFVQVVDARLAVAEQMVREGTPPARVYEAIMRTAQGPQRP